MFKDHQEWQAFWLPKKGNRVEEYEDAFAGDAKTGRFAIADGASESSFASIWAKLLVNGFVQKTEEQKEHWMATQRKRWLEEVGNAELPWYAQEKLEQGAFATFLGMVIKRGRWKAVAVGDCCVFQVRADKLVGTFPIGSSAAFNNRPALLGSRSAEPPRKNVEWGKWQAGDEFFLMTDALAQWFLCRHEEKRMPWQSLNRRLNGKDTNTLLEGYIEKLRSEKELKNDDVTFVRFQPR